MDDGSTPRKTCAVVCGVCRGASVGLLLNSVLSSVEWRMMSSFGFKRWAGMPYTEPPHWAGKRPRPVCSDGVSFHGPIPGLFLASWCARYPEAIAMDVLSVPEAPAYCSS